MFKIDISSRAPIYEQLCSCTERLITAGILKPGDAMPSVRKLAVELSVNPNTIQRAYTDMCSKGYICSVAGKGCFVAENAKEIISLQSHSLDDFRKAAEVLALEGLAAERLRSIIDDVYENLSNKEEKV